MRFALILLLQKSQKKNNIRQQKMTNLYMKNKYNITWAKIVTWCRGVGRKK
jgi:hypothetical protein